MWDKELAKSLFAATAPIFGLSFDELVQKSREQPRPEARFCVFHFMTNELGWGCKRIERSLPIRLDHSAVIQGTQRCDELYETDRDYADRCDDARRDMRTVTTNSSRLPCLSDVSLVVNGGDAYI